MANKEALRELQSRLAERLQAARTQSQGQSWLAVECGGMGLLLPLREAGEIFALATIVPVPHSHRWFMGVANLRGYLNGVVDLGGFLGVRAHAPSRDQAGREPSRLVGFNPEYGVNCALRVDRLAGLRSEGELASEAAEGGPRPAFVGMRMRDGAGRLWQELLMSALARDQTFLQIVG